METGKKIMLQVVKTTKKGRQVFYKEVKTNEENFEATILKLRKEKKNFKLVDNQQETVYNFNRNNYIITFNKLS